MKNEIKISDHSANGSQSANDAILTFCLAGQMYGLPITAVNQIIELVAITRIPNVPSAIQGVINVHGCIVPVIDLRQRFNLPFIPYHLHTPLILADADGRTLALVVDEVNEIIEINQPSSSLSETKRELSDLILGTINFERNLVPLVNVHGLLNEQEQKMLNQVISTVTSPNAKSENGVKVPGGIIK